MSTESTFTEQIDSLHMLPLSMMPLKTQSLRDAKLSKNARVESVIEMFSDSAAGLGHLEPEALPQYFDLEGERKADLDVILALSALPSFDVYSARIALREHGLDVDTVQHLKLSPEMERRVSGPMAAFTRPLIVRIYGEQESSEKKFSDIVELFKSPNAESAKKNLMALADKLEIKLIDIPNFLMRYGDAYLSLAYYEHCLSQIGPTLDEFMKMLRSLRNAPPRSANRDLPRTCGVIGQKLADARSGVKQVLDWFHTETVAMWRDISREGYQAMETMIQSYQQDIGGSVCALTVKLNSWTALKGKANPKTLVSFIMGDMLRGIERVKTVGTAADAEPPARAVGF